MKIGFQLEHVDPSRGGAETWVCRFAAWLLEAGHEVHLVAGGFGGRTPEGAFTHHVLQRGVTRWGRDLRFARAVRRATSRAGLDVALAVARTFGADVLMPHGGTLDGSRRQNLLLVRNPALRGLKQAFDAVNPRIRIKRAIEARQYDADDPPEVIAISAMVCEDMQTYHNVPDERLHLIYNGVDFERFSPAVCDGLRAEARARWGLAEGETCFALVAHNFRLKGLRELVEAGGRLGSGRGPWRVLVVGKGRAGPYRRLAQRLGCGARFIFAGALEDVRPAYAASDVYVQPTWYDPCSLVVLEALASGRPVITTAFNGASELITDGKEGVVLASPANTAALAYAMQRLLDPARREPMARAARATAEDHGLDRNFRDILAVLQKAARRKEET